ncbi:RNA 2',3'-cyclic phosphodiesterase [Jeotgalibacillus salarius]|uniref:RNA 2',3'-cyclic phosphodiesterase n=1 Tax=Jeotgalibacillus salarius TaxID=546023 RepID=A0A4Y8LB58_9BACL|nr:RNA 2',3'-cyclic phosphodiesterase [Jeotgalibacillus salarius]TFD98270.1 RNA 2',3'-cyclic phosphodiesterase [Jeotgalibacillus salarius]
MENHYFIACTLSEEAKDQLHNIRRKYLTHDCFMKYPHQNDLHVTLSFLGAVTAQQLKIICDELSEKLMNLQQFPLTFKHISTFGSEESPRVWWTGPAESKELTALYETVQSAVSKIHKNENRPFRPHVTLAKKWKGEKGEVFKGSIEPVSDWIKYVTIYEINPGQIPLYTNFASYKLKESGENHGTVN